MASSLISRTITALSPFKKKPQPEVKREPTLYNIAHVAGENIINSVAIIAAGVVSAVIIVAGAIILFIGSILMAASGNVELIQLSVLEPESIAGSVGTVFTCFKPVVRTWHWAADWVFLSPGAWQE